MKSAIKIIFLFSLIIISANIYAVTAPPIERDDFVAAVVNRTGYVIKFFPRDENVAIAITSGSSTNIFWDASPTLPIRFAGLPTGGQYLWICPEIQHINAGETITIFVKGRAEQSSDFYCGIEPAVD